MKFIRIVLQIVLGIVVLGTLAGVLLALVQIRAKKRAVTFRSIEQIEREEGVAVRLTSPVRRNFTEYMYCDGEIHAPVRALLRAQVDERVEDVLVDVGDGVTMGQLLVKFRTSDIEARIAAYEAAYEEAKNNYERYRVLLEKGVVSQDMVEARRTVMETTAAALKASRSALEFTEVRAPIGTPPGTKEKRVIVQERKVEPGEYKRSGDVLISLVDLSRVEVTAYVPETGVRYCSAGAGLDFRLEGEDRWRTGVINRISPATEDINRFFRVYANVQNEQNNGEWFMRPGMYAEIRIPLRLAENSLAVPAESVRSIGGAQYVYVVASRVEDVKVAIEAPARGMLGNIFRRGNVEHKFTTEKQEVIRAHKVKVQTGQRVDGFVQIIGDSLAETDKLVSSPRDDMRDGIRVKIVEQEHQPL
jgi:RND family efflux transporter MFP subunit